MYNNDTYQFFNENTGRLPHFSADSEPTRRYYPQNKPPRNTPRTVRNTLAAIGLTIMRDMNGALCSKDGRKCQYPSFPTP